MGGGLSKKKPKTKCEDGSSSPALHPDLLGCKASSRLTIPERHYVVTGEPTPLFSQASSRLNVVVDSSDLEEAKRILNEQEKELVRLRRLQMAKDRELELLKQQAVSRKSAAVASPDVVTKERKVIVGERLADNQSPDVPIVAKSDEIRDMIWEVCLDNVLFSDLELPYKRALTDPFAPIEVDAGRSVVTQGEIGDLFYIVETGHLRVFVKSCEDTDSLDDTSPENLTQFQVHSTLGKYVQFLGPHSSFGELALMYETPRAATVYAVTDCTLWAIKRDDCKTVLKDIQQGQMISRINFLRNVHIGDNDQKVVLGSLLTEHELNRLASALETETVLASEIIIRQGQPGNHFYIIESGEVSVHKNPANSGRRASVVADCNCVATIEAGGYFGELALINEDVRAASVKAVTDCTLLTLSRIDFVAHLGSFSERLAEAHHLEEGKDQARRSNQEDDSGAPTEDCNKMVSRAAGGSEVDIKDLVVLGTLGQGSFGTVRLVKHSNSGTLFACKCQPKYKIVRLKLQEYVATECNILNLCRSPFILRLHHALQTDRFVYLVVEFLPGGALYSHLQKLVCFAEPMMRFYVSQVVLAFTCLHEYSVVYRDLKPENLVLDARGYIKVIDFGLSKVLYSWKTWTMCGTPEYLAPEILKNEGHNHLVDFWMLGVLMFELAVGKGPFNSQDELELFEQILRMRPKYPRSFPKHLRDLTSRLLTNQRRRLGNSKEGWMSVRKHFWFNGFDWDGLEQQQTVPPLKPIISSSEYCSGGPELTLDAVESEAIPACRDWKIDFPEVLQCQDW